LKKWSRTDSFLFVHHGGRNTRKSECGVVKASVKGSGQTGVESEGVESECVDN
jgi:hypothetical protein